MSNTLKLFESIQNHLNEDSLDSAITDLYIGHNNTIDESEEVQQNSLLKTYQVTNYGWQNNGTTIYGELKDGNWYVYLPDFDFFEIYDTPITKEYFKYLYRDEDDNELQTLYDNFVDEHEITKNYDSKDLDKISREIEKNYYGEDEED